MKCSIRTLSFVLRGAMNDYILLLRLHITLGKNARGTAWHRKTEKSHA
jgi:hypothetical protein